MLEWMPGVTRHPDADGGSMVGGPPRAVWHVTQSDEGTVPGNVDWLSARDTWSHLLVDPSSGQMVQAIPFNRAARALENHPGGVETNRMGSVCLQVEVVGWVDKPFTDGPMRGLPAIVTQADALGIPRHYWPHSRRMSDAEWAAFSGHCGHMHVPENSHTDPGLIDWVKLLSPADVQEDDEMLILQGSTDAQYVVIGDELVHIPAQSDRSALNATGKVVYAKVSDALIAAIQAADAKPAAGGGAVSAAALQSAVKDGVTAALKGLLG